MAESVEYISLMAEDSESTSVMAEDSESTSLIAEDSSNKASEQSELDVLQYEHSTTESDKGDADTGGTAAATGGDVDTEEAGNLAKGDDRKELTGEVKEIETVSGEVSQNLQPANIELPIYNSYKMTVDATRAAAHTSRTAAINSRIIIDATRDAMNVGKSRVDEARRRAEEVAEFDEATRYRVLAKKYDAAIKLAARRAHQIEVAAESAENASMEAEIAADKLAEVSNEVSIEAEEKQRAACWAGNRANSAAIVAYKMEYVAVKAIKKCWQDLDPANETAGLPTRNPNEETRCGGRRHDKALKSFLGVAAFIFGATILTIVLIYFKPADNPNTVISLVTVASILVVMPVLYLLYKIFMCYRNKQREATRRENRNTIERIDDRLSELENYFEINNISPVHSEFEDED